MTPTPPQLCKGCKRSVKRLSSHFTQNPSCRTKHNLKVSLPAPDIPMEIHTEISFASDIVEDLLPTLPETVQQACIGRRTSRRKRKQIVSYAESVRPRVSTPYENLVDENAAAPDLNLNDYVATFLSQGISGDDSNRIQTNNVNPFFNNPTQASVDDTEIANDYWQSLFLDSTSVAAVAVPPQENESNDTNAIIPETLGSIHTMPFSVQQRRIVISSWDRSMSRLYQICDNARAPRYLCDKIMAQLRHEMTEHQFHPNHPGITQRNACMHRIQKATGSPSPEQIPITLESGSRVTVYRFPFMESYQRYLLSKPFSDIHNLDVDPTDPFGDPPLHPGRLEEMHDGRWFKDTYRDFLSSVERPHEYVFTDLAIYADKTGTDKIEKNSLEPVIAFCPLLKQFARESTSAHFLLGFIPNLSNSSSALRRGRSNRQGSKSMSVRDYHRCLEVLLSPLKKLQERKPIMYHRRGDLIKQARHFCSISAFVGDNKSHDMFVGRIADYGPTSPRISRRCLTEFSNCTQGNHLCRIMNSSIIERLSMGALGCVYGSYLDADDADSRVRQLQADRSAGVFESRQLRLPGIPPSVNFEGWIRVLDRQSTLVQRRNYIRLRKLRQKLCQQILHKVYGCHAVDNAFFGLDTGANKNGVFRATLSDILHTLDEGIFPKLLKVVYDIMPDTQRAQVDDYVEYLFGNGRNRSGERTLYPRVSFTRGYTQLTLLSASERVGQLFVLTILLQTVTGQDLLGPRFDSEFDKKRKEAQIRLGQRSPQREEEDSYSSASESNDDPSLVPEPTLGPTPNEIQNFLSIVDLEYVHTSIMPSLDTNHKDILRTVLSKTITKRSLSHVDGVDVEPFLLDYRKVDIKDNTDQVADDIHSEDFSPIEDIPIQEGRQECSIKLTMGQFGSLIETLMSFRAFLKYGTSLLALPYGVAKYKRALQFLRKGLVETIDRGEGTNNWNLQKFLEMSHFLLDIIDYGSAAGFSTNPFERSLKEWAKRPSATVQKRGDEIFSGQVCARLHEFFLIDDVAESQKEYEEEETMIQETIRVYGKNFRVFLTSQECKVLRILPSGKKHKIQIEFEVEVIDWFSVNYTDSIPAANESGDTPCLEIELYTEISIYDGKTKSRTKLRAHPNYQSMGSWYDFVYVTYDEDGQEDASTYPCKLISFFKDPNDGSAMALIQEVEHQTREQRSQNSQLFEHWRLCNRRYNETGKYKSILTAIPVESITDRFYAIDTVPDGKLSRATQTDFDILVVRYQKEHWPQSFLESPEFFNEIIV
jgi:hypothetical protein